MIANGTVHNAEEFWLFGYGSLIWKPPPHYDKRIPGYVIGYVRRFWQVGDVEIDFRCKLTDALGKDHRGTPEAPGRVVTLIERSFWETLKDPHDSESDRVWGTAYRIEASKVAEVREYLDIREINGYTIHYTPFHPADGSPSIKTIVYIGTPDNDQFMGPHDPQKLAEHIYGSKGPSGLNKDYLLSLDQALDELSPESGDWHVKDLAMRVKVMEARELGVNTNGITSGAVGIEHEKVSSTDEQEEVEK